MSIAPKLDGSVEGHGVRARVALAAVRVERDRHELLGLRHDDVGDAVRGIRPEIGMEELLRGVDARDVRGGMGIDRRVGDALVPWVVRREDLHPPMVVPAGDELGAWVGAGVRRTSLRVGTVVAAGVAGADGDGMLVSWWTASTDDPPPGGVGTGCEAGSLQAARSISVHVPITAIQRRGAPSRNLITSASSPAG